MYACDSFFVVRKKLHLHAKAPFKGNKAWAKTVLVCKVHKLPGAHVLVFGKHKVPVIAHATRKIGKAQKIEEMAANFFVVPKALGNVVHITRSTGKSLVHWLALEDIVHRKDLCRAAYCHGVGYAALWHIEEAKKRQGFLRGKGFLQKACVSFLQWILGQGGEFVQEVLVLRLPCNVIERGCAQG